MDDQNSPMHKKGYNLIYLRTIRGVTSLLNKGKHCQASANVGLENDKKATCMKEEYIVINKKDAGNYRPISGVSFSIEKGLFGDKKNPISDCSRTNRMP
mgnify:CR=1 FL=1